MTLTLLPSPCDREAERTKHALDLRQVDLDAGQALHLVERKIDHALGRLGLARYRHLRGLAAAEIEHHSGRELEPRQHEGGIDPAFEAVARIRNNAELAAGLRDVQRLPQRGFDQHVGGRLRAARGLAAHDAGERLHALLVGDHADRLVERVALAIERDQALAVTRAPDRQIAVHLGGIEHVQRAAAVVSDEIGDVDERVDRTQPDRDEPALQPDGRGAVLHPTHQS